MKKDFMNLMKAKTADVRPSLLSAEENIKSQITILLPLQNLIPPLTGEEQEQLEQNILKHGVKDPLTIWETTAQVAGLDSGESQVYVLVDGHNRYRIIQKHKLDFRINIVRFNNLDEVRDYMIDYQLGRRNLSPEQASYLRGLRYLQQKSMRGSNLQSKGPQVNVAETLAAEYGVSSRTIKRDADFAAGLEKLAPEVKQDILAGRKKMPKSAIQELVADPVPSLPEQPEALVVKARSGQSDETQTPQKQAEALRKEIRRLAGGKLDRKDCEQLLKKTGDLLALQLPK